MKDYKKVEIYLKDGSKEVYTPDGYKLHAYDMNETNQTSRILIQWYDENTDIVRQVGYNISEVVKFEFS